MHILPRNALPSRVPQARWSLPQRRVLLGHRRGRRRVPPSPTHTTLGAALTLPQGAGHEEPRAQRQGLQRGLAGRSAWAMKQRSASRQGKLRAGNKPVPPVSCEGRLSGPLFLRRGRLLRPAGGECARGQAMARGKRGLLRKTRTYRTAELHGSCVGQEQSSGEAGKQRGCDLS